MCGLAGVYRTDGAPAEQSLLLAMAGELRHRGPDGTGLYVDGGLGMVNTRLAIVDLEGGDQPLSDESGRYWVMQNGEVYNYVELRDELRALGRSFATTSDTEVIAQAYAEWGPRFLERLNGDFAIAVWDRNRRELLLARDRFGVRPLFLAEYGGDVCFASEAKAILRHPRARRELDPVGLVDTFTTWATLPDRSAFAGIHELAPAHYVVVGPEGVRAQQRWWDLEFAPSAASEDELVDELEALLVDATRLRLRADVPVATYLSGGLDSSAIAAIGARTVDGTLHAFGVGFTDGRFDESEPQDAIAREIGVEFQRTTVDSAAIAAAFPRVVELAEKPLLRTAPG
jgi:asparagine synthase (glutamine-hydrolysing)